MAAAERGTPVSARCALNCAIRSSEIFMSLNMPSIRVVNE